MLESIIKKDTPRRGRIHVELVLLILVIVILLGAVPVWPYLKLPVHGSKKD